jgi:excisionase family DNA binding protein
MEPRPILLADNHVPMLDVRAVAGHLGVSNKAVRGLILRGELRAYKVANRLRIHHDDLNAYLRASLVEPPGPAPAVVLPPPVGRAGGLRDVFRAQQLPFPPPPDRA